MSGEKRGPDFRRLCQLTVVLVWIVALCFLRQGIDSNRLLGKFLRPDYWWLVDMGASILICFLAALVYRNPRGYSGSGARLLTQMGILLLPVFYLPTAVTTQFGLHASQNWSLSMGEYRGRTVSSSKNATPDEGLSANPSMLSLVGNPEAYDGKTITITGKVFSNDELPPKSFLCYRLLMFCCAADARPIGILVESGERFAIPEKGGWARVEGTVGFASFKDRRLPKITATAVTAVAPPRDPYLCP